MSADLRLRSGVVYEPSGAIGAVEPVVGEADTGDVATPARSIYDVCILDPQPGDYGWAFVRGWIGMLLGSMAGSRPRVTVEIVTVEDDDTLAQWRLWSQEARPLKEKIESDLDRMDAVQFATEWGLPTSITHEIQPDPPRVAGSRMHGPSVRRSLSTNTKGFVAAIILGVAAAAIVVVGVVNSRGVAATLGLISGAGLVLLGQVRRTRAASPNRRNNAIAAAGGILVLPIVGLIFGSGTKDDVATFIAAFLLPTFAYLIVAARVAAAKDPAYWRADYLRPDSN